jgi:hypothetical protein
LIAVATILFFDDWVTQNSRGLTRQWFRAEPWPGFEPVQDPALTLSFHYCSILRDAETGLWRLWSHGQAAPRSAAEQGSVGISGTCLYESTDGLDWRACTFDPPVDLRAGSAIRNVVFSGNARTGGACVVRDDGDPDAARRYKMVYLDALPGRPDAAGGQIAVSGDGVHWKADPGAVWSTEHVDTFHSTQFNPYTRMWQWMSRPISGDRRVAIYQTPDFRHFSGPLIVMHPDPSDPPCVEFYGMPHFFYEGYGVGFLWRMHSTYDETGTPHRMRGKVDCELTYSVSGVVWNRTNRQNFMPDSGFGPRSFRSEYPSCMVVDDEGWIRVYSSSFTGEHNDGMRIGPEERRGAMTVSRLRRDGFCALETVSDTGHVTLRPLISRGGDIRLNAVTARFGAIRGELRTVPDDTPIPGYELANCVPIEGDGHFLTLRWKQRETIDPFKGQAFRIHLQMDRARLYAIRVSADYLFGAHIHRNLAGETEPGGRPEFLQPGRDKAYPTPATPEPV